jgi:hypothetical protein
MYHLLYSQILSFISPWFFLPGGMPMGVFRNGLLPPQFWFGFFWMSVLKQIHSTGLSVWDLNFVGKEKLIIHKG